MFGPRTLRRYVAKRFLVAILGAFTVCAVLIFMIDMVELLRLSRRATDICMLAVLWIALLRLPAYTEILLAFAVLVGGIGALLSLNRKSELIVMRAGGMSVWQFLRPGLAVALVLGIFAVAVYNPLAAAARSEAERRVAEAFGRTESTLLAATGEESWLRQDGTDGQSVMSARAAADQGLTLAGVIVYQFDPAYGYGQGAVKKVGSVRDNDMLEREGPGRLPFGETLSWRETKRDLETKRGGLREPDLKG